MNAGAAPRRGYQPNATDFRSHPLFVEPVHILGALLSASTPLPEMVTNSDVLPQIGGIRDQGQSSACVGFSFAEVLALTIAKTLGIYMALSALFAYWAARAAARRVLLQSPKGNPLTDGGAQPALAVIGLIDAGICSEAAKPFDVANINQEELEDEAGDAVSRLPVTISAFSVIPDGAGPVRILAVRQALALGHGVALSINSSTPAFENADGTQVLTSWGVGGWDHMVSLIDYKPDPSSPGHYLFRLWNHWGTTWATSSDIPGTVWVDESFVNASADLTIAAVQPSPAKAAA